MAVNPQQILSQTVPTAQQPTAQQTPIQQAPATLAATQFPGAGQIPGIAQPANLLSTAIPGQQTQPGLLDTATAGPLGNLPALQPYLGSVPYLAALESQPQIPMPQLDDPTLEAIQQKLLAQQQSNPLLNGKQQPHPQSQIAKTQSPMNPLQFIESVGQNLWQQEIVQPVQDYIQTWQRDPKMGLLETLGGIGVTAAIIGAEAVTGGAATPVIFAALAATQAPGLINAFSKEVTHPSDANLVQAVVSTGGAFLTVGSPLRALRGVKTLRNTLEFQVKMRKDAVTLDQIADLLVGARKDVVGQLKTGAPIAEQLETLDLNNLEALRDQMSRRNVSLEEGPGADLVRHVEALQPLREALRKARDAGDDEARLHAVADIKQYAKQNLRDPMLSTAYHYLMLPSTPYAHVPVGAIQGVSSALAEVLDNETNKMYGALKMMHSGIGLQTPQEIANASIASIKEAEGLDRAAGSPFYTANRIMTSWQAVKSALAKEMGIKSIDSDHVEKLLQALEEPDKWKALSTDEQAVAQKLRDVFDMMTVGEMRFGTIAQPLQGRVAHFFSGPGKPSEDIEDVATSSWLLRPVGSRSRFWKAAVDDNGNIEFIGRNRSQILESTGQQTQRAARGQEVGQVYNPNAAQFKSWRQSYAQLKRHKNAARQAAIVDQVRQQFGDQGVEILQMGRKELDRLLLAKAPERVLVTGEEAIRRQLSSHIFRMQRAMYGEALHAHAHLNVQTLKDLFGKLPQAAWGARMEMPAFKSAHDYPDILPETIFNGNSELARSMDYFLVHPATGRPTDLNYRPALYARGKLANQIQAATEKMSNAEMQSAWHDSLYKVSAISKRYIMYNPLYHGWNVSGRLIAYVLSDPRAAGGSFKALRQLMEDPAAYYHALEEASMAGLVHADQWNVSDKLRRLQREDDGQPSFYGAVRNVGRALDNFHKDVAERQLWSTVDHLQMAGYLYSKQRFLDKGIQEAEARKLAATYANNLGGMVNPLYMSKLWRQMKGLLFFAPSYWTTFLHSVQSVMPGAARLSQAVNDVHGGRFVRMTAVPLRAIDRRSRTELVRAQRDWMITYMATTAVAMDMMNVMFSGHHLWDNEQGHEWNIDVTNLPGLGGTQTTPSGEVRPAYITAMPFFRQGVDLGNAFGLGHDWGFAHQFGDQTWRQQDAFHKATLSAGALMDGVRRTASTKLGQVPQVGYQVATGEELTARLGQGTQIQIPRWQAFANLFPAGYQIQRFFKEWQQGYQQYQPGTPEYNKAVQQFWDNAKRLGLNTSINMATGLPSVYHLGVEKPLVDDTAFQRWQKERTDSHDRLKKYSDQVFSGAMTPLEYERHKHEETIRLNQSSADTWGDQNSSAKSLNTAYADLSQQFGLDNAALSDQDWFDRYDRFQDAWEQLLQSASPSTRSLWWEHHTAQWTDADYLAAEAKELKNALAASIDGQGGKYIRAFQNRLFRLRPTMTVQEQQDMEDSDPYYSTYVELLKEMGRTSALGAFVSAFSSPYSQTYVPPKGLSQEEAAALAEHTGRTVVRPEDALALAKRAEAEAQEPAVAQSGGQFAASPEGLQEEQAAIAAARQAAAEG